MVFLSGCQLVSALGFAPKPLPFDKNPACHFQRPEFSEQTPAHLLTFEAFKNNTTACLSNESTKLERLQYAFNFKIFDPYFFLAKEIRDKDKSNIQKFSEKSLFKVKALEFWPNGHLRDYEVKFKWSQFRETLEWFQFFLNTPELLKWAKLNETMDQKIKELEVKPLNKFKFLQDIIALQHLETEVDTLFKPLKDQAKLKGEEAESDFYQRTYGWHNESLYKLNSLIHLCGKTEDFTIANDIPENGVSLATLTTRRSGKVIAIKPNPEGLELLAYYNKNSPLVENFLSGTGNSIFTKDFLQNVEKQLRILSQNNRDKKAIENYSQLQNESCETGC